MEINTNTVAFKPVSDFIESARSDRREQMSPIARLVDLILSYIGIRPTDSKYSESFAKELSEHLHTIMIEHTRQSVTLRDGISLSVDPDKKTAILCSPYGKEACIPYPLLLTICMNFHLDAQHFQNEGVIYPASISYEKCLPEKEIDTFLADQKRGFNANTTINYRVENGQEPHYLDNNSLSTLANILAARTNNQKNDITQSNVNSSHPQNIDKIEDFNDTDINRIVSVCNQGFMSIVPNNLVLGIRSASGDINIIGAEPVVGLLHKTEIPYTLVTQLLCRTSLPQESPVNHTLIGDDITSTWSGVGLPIYDQTRQEWEYTKCDVTVSGFRNGTAFMSLNFHSPEEIF